MPREVVVGYRRVKGPDGRYGRHSVVDGIEGEVFDLTKVRRAVAGVGRGSGEPMRGIVLNRTFVEGGFRVTLSETGGVSSVREARVKLREYVEHGAVDPL